jgi:hypothetical protein
MNSDSEAINKFLAWLLQESENAVAAPSGDRSNSGTPPEQSGLFNPQLHDADPVESEEVQPPANNLPESSHFYFEEIPFVDPGDVPAVQDRFYTLLKRRLRAEIERRPPLFPWETDVCDYDAVMADRSAPELVSAGLWTSQLSNLNVPVPMPDTVLAQLFQHCQGLVNASLKEGAKLVRVVEELFPGQSQTLNNMASTVLMAPARSGTASLEAVEGIPERYEVASQPQQMAISLLATREILRMLTISVSPKTPRVERQWTTREGLLTLTAELSPSTPGHIRVKGSLPCSGQLQFKGGETEAIAQRSSPGVLSVELFDMLPNRPYPLEVHLVNSDEPPLSFAVQQSVA